MARYTNKHNLPDWRIRLMDLPYEPKEGRFSVTELIGPPLIRRIKLDHWDELVWDYSEFLQSSRGSLLHAVKERLAGPGQEAEQKLEHEFMPGATVVGKLDMYDGGIVRDYKHSRVGYLKLHGADVEAQLNMYAELCRRNGKPVTQLEAGVEYMNWDWKLATFTTPYPYPPIPFEASYPPLWPTERAVAYITARLEAHLAKPVPVCTPEERWQGRSAWAVLSGENQTAKRVCQSKEQAEDWLSRNKVRDPWIQERPGGSLRCKFWCNGIREFCPLWRSGQCD